MELEILRVEVLKAKDEEVEDEVDVVEIILRMIMKRNLISRIDVVENKEKTKEISQEWRVLNVASTTRMQKSANRESATTNVVRLTALQSIVRLRQNGETNLLTKDA